MGATATKETFAAAAPDKRARSRQGVKGERTRQRIKSAFADLLDAKSFASVTIADICRTADITVGGFYFHFASQEDLLDEVMGEYISALVEDLERALKGHGPAALAEAVCEAFLKAYAERIGLARTFQQLTRMRADYAMRWRVASQDGMARLAAKLCEARPDLSRDRSAFLAYALVTMITSKLDLVYVYRDRSDAAAMTSRIALARDLPELWRRMVDGRRPA